MIEAKTVPDYDLDSYPVRDMAFPKDNPLAQLNIGDGHGNALKLISIALQKGILVPVNKKELEQDYASLVKVYHFFGTNGLPTYFHGRL